MSTERFNAADPEKVRARQRADKDAREAERDELRELLKLPHFRRYVWRLIGRCKLME